MYSSSKTWGNGFSVDAFLSRTQNFKDEANFNNRIFSSNLYAAYLENLVKRTTEHIAKVHAIPFIPAGTIPGSTTTQPLPLETCSGQPHPTSSALPFQADKRVRADEEPGWRRRHTQECPSWSRTSFIWLCFDLLY